MVSPCFSPRNGRLPGGLPICQHCFRPSERMKLCRKEEYAFRCGHTALCYPLHRFIRLSTALFDAIPAVLKQDLHGYI